MLGLDTNGGVQHLALHATVTAGRPGRASMTFTLTPTTANDIYAFAAPVAPWRIAGGAVPMLVAPAAQHVTAGARV
ncbi:MAG TPA: hypothetical protein VI318_03485 [Baekduia sp.]